MGSLVTVRYDAGSWSSYGIDVRGQVWAVFFVFFCFFVFFRGCLVLLNLPERFLLLIKQTTNDSLSSVRRGSKVLPI